MLALLFWLAGTVGLGWLIAKYHLLRPGLAAMADLGFVAWLICGAGYFAQRMRGPGIAAKEATEWAKAIHEAQRREEAARKERENVGK